MRIVYVTSGLITCIREEISAHRAAGWRVLPLVGSPPKTRDYKLGDLPSADEPVRYRPGVVAQAAGILRETALHPVRMLRVFTWLVGLIFADPLEFAKAVYEVGPACAFAADCRRFGGQHVHVHFASRSLNLGVALSILLEIPVSCTVHAFDLFTRGARSLRYRLVRCRIIVSISRFNVGFLERKCGTAVAEKMRVVYCGIPVEKFLSLPRKENGFRILSIGDLIPMKGQHDLVKACGLLNARGVDFRLDIVGRGPMKDDLKEIASTQGIDDRVFLREGVSDRELHALLSHASVFVLACRVDEHGNRDGIPMALMEAMACGIPVVSTLVSGVPELIRKDLDGLLVKGADPAGLAQAVERLSQDAELRTTLARSAREHVQAEFDILRTSEELRRLFSDGSA